MLNTDTPKGNLEIIVRHFCRYTFRLFKDIHLYNISNWLLEKYKVAQCDGEQDSLSAIKNNDDILTNAELMTNEELENLNNNGSEGRMEFITYNYKADLAEFELEEERLNSEAWQHFEELTSVVSKIEKLSDIFDEIQAILHTVVVKKDDDSIWLNLSLQIIAAFD